MCEITADEAARIGKDVREAQTIGLPFTGYDIFCGLYYKLLGKKEVSGYVRDLFNSGFMPGWASVLVGPPGKGPVLYFKVGLFNWRAYQKMRKILREKPWEKD